MHSNMHTCVLHECVFKGYYSDRYSRNLTKTYTNNGPCEGVHSCALPRKQGTMKHLYIKISMSNASKLLDIVAAGSTMTNMKW